MAITDADIQLLLKTPLFSGLNPGKITPFLDGLVVCEFAKGDTIFNAGDKADRLYLVLSGWVRLNRTTRDGEDAIVGLFTRGELFAEAAMFLSRGFPAAAQAGAPTRLLAIDARIMLEAIRRDPELALGMLASMSIKMKALVEQITLNRMKSTHERVAEFLLSLCTRESGREVLDLPYEKKLIATHLGMTPESFSRALARLREAGVKIEGSTTVIGDVGKLRLFVERIS